MSMSQPSFWWQRYGTMAQAAVALLGKNAAKPAYLATYGAEIQQWVEASMKTASVTPPDCKLGKT
jgi:hypothetical protein